MILFRGLEEDAIARGLPHAASRWHAAVQEAEKAAILIGEAIASFKKPIPE